MVFQCVFSIEEDMRVFTTRDMILVITLVLHKANTICFCFEVNPCVATETGADVNEAILPRSLGKQ